MIILEDPKTRKNFAEDFRKKADWLTLNRDLSRHKMADDHGVGHSTLGKWIPAYRHDDLMAGPHDDLQKELAPLRKENRILREERDLKKSTAFFANQK